MRILQLRFKNLNSLSGEWRIDFTHPDYSSAGLFAITGPTGAGKSTILDALCLALYGRTPRLGKISASSNEILSRQHAECFAEVEFLSGEGQYRCHWSQRRARNQVQGNLQQPKQELVDAQTNKVLHSKLNEVAVALEEITGMDFERFTRSILLAQGGFDAFLKADADQRSPILEQLTGTEIYSQISIQVHERRGQAQKELERLKEQIASVQLLSSGQVAGLQEERIQLNTDCESLKESQTVQKHAIAWWQQQQQLEADRTALAQRQEQLTHEQVSFAPQHQRYSRALRALELAAPAQELSQCRQQSQELQKQQVNNHDKIESLQNSVTLSQTELKQIETLLQQQQQSWQQLQPQLREARRLDVQIQSLDRQIESVKNDIKQKSEKTNQLEESQKTCQEQFEQAKNQLSALDTQRQQSIADADLIEEYNALSQSFDHLKNLYRKLQKTQEQHQAAANEYQESMLKWQQLEPLNLAAKQTYLKNENQRKALEQNDHERLQGATRAEWRQRAQQAQETWQQGQLLARVWRDQQDQQEQQQTLATASHQLSEQIKVSQQNVTALEKRIKLHKDKLSLLQQQQLLLKRIDDLSQLRHELVDGQACPLCGALEHPYVVEKPNLGKHSQTALKQTAQALELQEQELQQQQRKLAQQESDFALNQQKQQQSKNLSIQLNKQIDELRRILNWPVDDQQLNDQLENQLTRWQQADQSMATQLAELEQLQSTLTQQTKDTDQARKLWQQQQELSDTLNNAQQRALDRRDHLNRDQEAQAKELATAGAALKRDLLKYGFTELSAQRLEPVLEQLKQRRSRWLELKQKEDTYQQAIQYEQHELIAIQTALKEQHTSHAQNQRVLQVHSQERSALQELRHNCLQTDDVDALEKNQQDKLTELEQSTRVAKDNHQQALQTLTQQQNNAEQTQAKQKDLAETLRHQQKQFQQLLITAGFTDETDYTNAVLSTGERQRLQQQSQQLAQEEQQLAALHKQWQENSKALQAQASPQSSREQAETRSLQIEQEQSDKLQQLGRIQQQLDEHERLHQQQATKALSLKAQEEEYRRWQAMHKLIGSSDGKRYRNFVQGLTFDRLIAQANRELQKMSSRYLLIRDQDAGLDLNVIDHYQAGEQRTSKNLSGGESFIVSLALALGLSHMASHKARVDSLFLDEGFGTLDEDALELALDALSSLQQEGKLIGLISHVPALKERIAVQIEVQTLKGGLSQLSGPGCSKAS